MSTDWGSILRRARLSPFAEPETEYDYAVRRMPGRMYLSKTFQLRFESSQDFGRPARYAIQVHDIETDVDDDEKGWDCVEHEVHRSPTGRVQIKAMVAREDGLVREVKFQRIDGGSISEILRLRREQAQSFIAFVRSLVHVPVDGEDGDRIDDAILREVFQDPKAVSALYERDPDTFRSLIEDDVDAEDIAALAHRRAVVRSFRSWLEDDTTFDAAAAAAGGPEKAWQKLFEDEPWLLGIGLGGQLFTAWDASKLEQPVRGFAIDGAGKRVDALLRTAGSIRSVVLAEIKHHKTELLSGTPYRPDCWSPSRELAGAVVQVQQTAYVAARDVGELLRLTEPDGSQADDVSYLVRPRTYLVVGRLESLRGAQGGVHEAKFRSFELYRRNLYEPEVLTFDELLARAESLVDRLEKAEGDERPVDEPTDGLDW